MKTSAALLLFSAAMSLLLLDSSADAMNWPYADDNWCSANHSHSNGLVSYAETREERLPSASENYINPGQNGSIRVYGWKNSDVRVRACLQASASSDAEARALASGIRITDGPGRIEPTGPSTNEERHWNVSYEVWLPDRSNIELAAHNGSIHVDTISGTIRFHTENGSVHLNEISGDIDGYTTNGSLTVDVASSGWKGEMHVKTTNGSVHLNLPDGASAQVRASTVNGRVHSDFPATVSGRISRSNLSFQIGSGGPVIEARTVNGSVHIARRT